MVGMLGLDQHGSPPKGRFGRLVVLWAMLAETPCLSPPWPLATTNPKT